jgi:hypothetical protein
MRIVIVLVIGLAFWAGTVVWTVTRNSEARHALCEVRADIGRDIRRTENLLEEFPSDSVFGIPRQLIEEGLRDDRQTYDALSDLDCKEE